MATIREWLNEKQFDWNTGKIVYHPTEDEATDEFPTPGWNLATGAEWVFKDSPILDREFDSGYGGPRCPRFIAIDSKFIYFPAQYDGSTWLEKHSRFIDDYYYDWKTNPTPYPGA